MKDEITLEMLRQTAFEMKRMSDFHTTSLKDLGRRAYELLREYQGIIEHFKDDECSFREGIKIVTGLKRVREEQIKKVELFYEQTYALDPDWYSRGNAHPFYQWRVDDSMPLRWCQEAAPKFAQWNRRRRSEIEQQKRIGSAKPKWDENRGTSKQKEEDF